MCAGTGKGCGGVSYIGEERSQDMVSIGGGFEENQTGAVHIFFIIILAISAMACAVVVFVLVFFFLKMFFVFYLHTIFTSCKFV